MTMKLRRLLPHAAFAAFGFTGAAAQQAPASAGTAPDTKPAAPVAPPPGKVATSPNDTVGRITLVDEQPAQVIALLEKLTGRMALRSQDLPAAKINFSSGRDLTRREAEVALESLLALNGIAVLPSGEGFLKVVPAMKGKDAGPESPPLYLDSVAALPPSDRFVARLFTLKNVPYAGIDAAVQAVVNKARGGSAVVMPATNSVLVTDSLLNVQRLESIIGRMDVPNKVVFIPLKHTRATEVVKQLKSLQAGGLKTAFAGDVGFEASEVANQIMVVTNPSNEARIREIVAGLDTENTPVTRSELLPLRHAEAPDVVEIIQNLASGKSGSVGTLPASANAALSASRSRGASASNTRRGTSPNGQVYISQNYNIDPSKAAAANDDASFSDYFTAVADIRSNAIVVYGTERDIRQAKDILAKVDVQLQQVRIEAVIVEVTLGTAQASGLETLGIGLYTGTQGVANGRHNGDFNANANTANLPGTGKPPLSVRGSLKDFSLEAIFNKCRDDNRAKMLSRPVIVTSHNKEATIKVGQRQPIITGSTSSTVTAGTVTSQVSYEDIGLKLVITPRIGANGVVEMNVNQVIESIVGTTVIDGNSQPIIGNREANSYLTAQNDEVIVLAGLQAYNDQKTKGKVWLLGSIPFIGPWLFQPETTTSTKTELIIFLKTHVLTDADRVPSDTTPGLRPGSQTREPAMDAIRTGTFREVSEPSTIFEEEEAERRAKARKKDEESKSAKPREPMRGMHD